jgi:hypothetical protein
MLRLMLRYGRYTVTALIGVGFRLAANQCSVIRASTGAGHRPREGRLDRPPDVPGAR